MDLGLNGKIAVVAGGGRGCGRAIAEELAREGARVAITGRDPDIIGSTVDEMKSEGLNVLGLTGDMEDEARVAEWMRTLRAHFGEVDILVTNPPGHATRNRGFEKTSNEEFATSTSPWVMPIVYFLREMLPSMKARKWGRIVNLASEAVKVPHLTDPMYSANMRVAAVSMIKTLSHEYGRYNITANTIATGPFLTPLSKAYMEDAGAYGEQEMLDKTTAGRWGRPDEMGAVVAFLCSERASWVNGETIRVDGGYGHSLF